MKLRNFSSLFLTFCLTLGLAPWVIAAAPVIDVNVKGISRQSLTLSGMSASGTAGHTFFNTLRNDLLRCGWYRLAPTGQVKVNGSVSGEAGVAEKLFVSWPGKRFAWERSAVNTTLARRHAHELADAIVQATTGEKGIAQSRFAMVYQSGKKHTGQAIQDLYICDYDGQNLKRITTDGSPIVGPRWGADGRSLYFTSYRLGYAAVFKADVKSGVIERLANFKGLSTGVVPSPKDPNQLAIILSHQGNPELYVMNAITKKLTRLTRTKLAAEASPCWSPDGKQICYVSDASGSPQLYIVDVATAQSRRLTLKGGESVQPDWSKNGIVFATRRGAPYRIAIMDPNKGESSLRYLTPVNEQYESPSWAPDGRHVVTARTQGRETSIWVLDAAEKGEEPYKPFSGRGTWLNPAWSR
ncbi:MAG: PD40 domain-containing protein [Kiritimatiellae bacterium]|nr:PD40 domain-containing protein [Kiritimatiellia bacterium]